MTRLAGGIKGDGNLRQLRHPDRQVDISQRVVGEPIAAIAARVLTIHSAAVMKLCVVITRPGQVGLRAGVTKAAELRRRDTGDEQCHGHQDESPEPHRHTVADMSEAN